jgi:hypothetical protein
VFILSRLDSPPKLGRTHLIRDPSSQNKLFNLGTSQRAIDDFVIHYCDGLVKRDFTFKTEKMSALKKGKREYLNDIKTNDFTAKLNGYFETHVEIPRIKVGNRQTIETSISEEALLLAKALRNEINRQKHRSLNLPISCNECEKR